MRALYLTKDKFPHVADLSSTSGTQLHVGPAVSDGPCPNHSKLVLCKLKLHQFNEHVGAGNSSCFKWQTSAVGSLSGKLNGIVNFDSTPGRSCKLWPGGNRFGLPLWNSKTCHVHNPAQIGTTTDMHNQTTRNGIRKRTIKLLSNDLPSGSRVQHNWRIRKNLPVLTKLLDATDSSSGWLSSSSSNDSPWQHVALRRAQHLRQIASRLRSHRSRATRIPGKPVKSSR
mmetsp:Transcript_51698/g.149089  ORF Transcript_51698/g.149089 Transcript_51698/m.149089 type:complete len:227 (+) Transcript_51698:58-738(+)